MQHTIQIKSETRGFVDYVATVACAIAHKNSAALHPFTSRDAAGHKLRELQEATKGHGFEYRIKSA